MKKVILITGAFRQVWAKKFAKSLLTDGHIVYGATRGG